MLEEIRAGGDERKGRKSGTELRAGKQIIQLGWVFQ
jgi:hypothetical protein